MINVEEELGKAVKNFWKVRSRQHKRQGSGTGTKDAGNRAAVTGGKHADRFVQLIGAIVHDAGLRKVTIHATDKTHRTLPGFFGQRRSGIWSWCQAPALSQPSK